MLGTFYFELIVYRAFCTTTFIWIYWIPGLFDQCWPGLTTADQPTRRRDTALPRICAVTSRGDCRLPPGLYRLPPGLCRARRPCRAALRSDRSRLPYRLFFAFMDSRYRHGPILSRWIGLTMNYYCVICAAWTFPGDEMKETKTSLLNMCGGALQTAQLPGCCGTYIIRSNTFRSQNLWLSLRGCKTAREN
ncbi:hypothetical protein J6590_032761 [Homalodisca vitripennis]|nr:hypothetical protein J6590_095391 [Homalodisca vitripennis]KAG8322027.1 hypothetical protein J6590_032761 [Homalodisca vitripennis]